MDAQNRENFLNKLAERMGRPRQLVPEPMPAPLNDYATTRLTDLDPQALCQTFIESAKAMMVDVIETNEAEAKSAVLSACEKYGGGSIILTGDERLEQLGITQDVQANYDADIWLPQNGEENLKHAEQANIGINYAEYGLAESGGVVLFSGKDKGRSVSLLPEKSIVVVRKSLVLPRVAQLAKILHDKAVLGERMPSCVNIISGPSSTADIELVKVVGVHGPTTKVYVVIDDLA
ncbi:LutC/YkgG family protein [Avibacterium endocarditidis]|uniref:L-lactate dehydrogenase complex protein LldG n=1 Tax=Avibacterium gallinarum TaxID=755 RepID=A0A379AXF2_AVIGA|nr:lactate utilization protein C [Avibacterium gallinarum]POY44720.1 lactate utilization protein C [Avibacterium gallinarum]TDP30517.1 L-lactate dehydrogenase complex protein LldG [Avibacterium gallinarum]SUB27017.1 protein YkgG [Avibacterium gallinarum]